ncbi:putative fluoride ion transporter CrcB [Alphaproteobacteria bacterium]|nr:putative fluoride ion transporter CrcB [Alphaproteobacteria bacterium]
MHSCLLVFIGAGLGGMARHGINILSLRLASPFPVGTLAVNISGSFLMGLVVAFFAAKAAPFTDLRLFLTTGLLGGFTTFSAFSLECVLLLERGETGSALLYIASSVLVSLTALFAAMELMKRILDTLS